MSEFTRPATWEDVKQIARYLNEAGAEYALIGGYAIGAHGFNRFTEDVDILVSPSRENGARWILALARLPDGAARELAAEPHVFQGERRYAIRINDEITVDVLASAAGLPWDALQPYIEEIAIDDVPVRVLSLEGLLLTKSGARPKDQMDAALLRQAIDALKRGS